MTERQLLRERGRRIRTRREDLEWDARHLADLVGLAPKTVYNIESGGRASRLAMIRIARALKLEPDDLVTS